MCTSFELVCLNIALLFNGKESLRHSEASIWFENWWVRVWKLEVVGSKSSIDRIM